MRPIHSTLTGIMLLLMAACQTGNPPRFQNLYTEYQLSARHQLEQKLDPDMRSEITADAEVTTGNTVDSVHKAQQLAMRHSKRVAGIFADLGIHQAESVQHQLLENPGLELSLIRPADGGRWQMEFSISLGLLDWLSRQQRVTLADTESARWQAQAWQLLNDELMHVRGLWLQAVAAQQKLGIYRELLESASVSEDFAVLLFEAGNISELELLSHQSIADQRQAQLIQAELEAIKSLNTLQLSLGLEGTTTISVPGQLPAIAQSDADAASLNPDQLMQLARANQPALQLSKFELQQTGDALALALRRTALREAGLELVTERESDGERQHGFSLSMSAPLFDNGDTELSVMQGQIQRQHLQQHQIESETSAGIRDSLQEIRSSLQQLDLLASDELPRFRRMMSLGVEEYNFMLRGTFELLTVADLMLDARLRQVDGAQQYWTAYSNLENLIGTRLPEANND